MVEPDELGGRVGRRIGEGGQQPAAAGVNPPEVAMLISASMTRRVSPPSRARNEPSPQRAPFAFLLPAHPPARRADETAETIEAGMRGLADTLDLAPTSAKVPDVGQRRDAAAFLA
ncbi:hypothetical protein ACFYXH_09900 [Streptomyces sp. NPDC002730]|uniref:hypothetical protein n=1 Tax=Streptomyces sp. NPDC002730 TaxID=3364662 RepID=UPI00369C0959